MKQELNNDVIENKKEKTTLILIILSIATVLVTIVGSTFAYFTLTVQGNNTSSSVIVKTATIGINYDSGNEIRAEYILPGDAIPTKTFTLTNSGDSAIQYIIKWTNITNDFSNPSELIYQITGTSTAGGSAATIAQTPAPTTNGNIATGISINPEEVHTYVLEMFFPNTSSVQNANQGKTFMGKIEIELQ